MRVLTKDAQKRQDSFMQHYGDLSCTCHLGHPPCGYCTHPGNPNNGSPDWEHIEILVFPTDDGLFEITANDTNYTQLDRDGVKFDDLGGAVASIICELKLRS